MESRGILIGASLLIAACSGAPTPPPATSDARPSEAAPERQSLGVEAEIGALDEDKVKVVFQKAAPRLSACYDQGAERVPYLAGDVSFRLRITKGGTVRWAHVKESTLGDRETEACMLAILKGAGWPRPVGGEGLAENSYAFEPSSEDRPPVAWAPSQLGAPFRKAQGALAQCRSTAGTGAMKATLYVDTDGKASAVGVATADERGEAAVSCVIATLKALTFPSPGSYASKVSVTIE